MHACTIAPLYISCSPPAPNDAAISKHVQNPNMESLI